MVSLNAVAIYSYYLYTLIYGYTPYTLTNICMLIHAHICIFVYTQPEESTLGLDYIYLIWFVAGPQFITLNLHYVTW